MSRATARKYLALLAELGLIVEPGLTSAAVRVFISERCPWLTGDPLRSRLSLELRALEPDIAIALTTRTPTQVYDWLRVEDRFDGSYSTLLRYVKRAQLSRNGSKRDCHGSTK